MTMITSETIGNVTYVTIDRANEANAFTSEMIKALKEKVHEAAAHSTILALRSEGADFSTGRDRKEPRTTDPYSAYLPVTELNLALSTFPGVVVTAVQGRAMGFGVGIVMRSDIAIAGEDTTFSLDEVKHGIPPMFLMAAISDHVAPKHALDVVLTSRPIKAPEAMQIGLISRIVPSSTLRNSFEELVKELSTRDPAVLLTCKRYFRDIKLVHGDSRHSFALSEQTRFTMTKR